MNGSTVEISKQQGTSTVELMLATALALFLLTGLIELFLSSKRSWDLQQAIVHLQDNARYAGHFVNQEIRMAGYAACEASPPFTKPEAAIIGYGQILPPSLQGKVVKGTDSIVVGRCHLENGKEQFKQYAYFISPTSRKNKLGKSIIGLYEMPIGSSKHELVPNIENMKIIYGMKTSDHKNIAYYASADKIIDWHLVGAVKIEFSLSSQDPILSKPSSYQFAGQQMPADRYLHSQSVTYIALRDQ